MRIGKSGFIASLIGTLFLVTTGGVLAQTTSPHQMMHGDMSPSVKAMKGMQITREERMPTLPGQEAFGTIQEIVSILEADPSTDWSRVEISTLRSHLVDMDLLMMDTKVREKRVDGGLEMVITGQDRTLLALQTMVPAHVPMINGMNGWAVSAEVTSDFVKLLVTAADAKETVHIRGLGFYGLMTSGAHHQMHHLALARGENVHTQ